MGINLSGPNIYFQFSARDCTKYATASLLSQAAPPRYGYNFARPCTSVPPPLPQFQAFPSARRIRNAREHINTFEKLILIATLKTGAHAIPQVDIASLPALTLSPGDFIPTIRIDRCKCTWIYDSRCSCATARRATRIFFFWNHFRLRLFFKAEVLMRNRETTPLRTLIVEGRRLLFT